MRGGLTAHFRDLAGCFASVWTLRALGSLVRPAFGRAVSHFAADDLRHGRSRVLKQKGVQDAVKAVPLSKPLSALVGLFCVYSRDSKVLGVD